jgi:predicted dehydrogenase
MANSVAFIGTGPDPDNPQAGESFAMAYNHAGGYERLEQCELVACADLVEANARAFADNHDIDADAVYEDYETMLTEQEPDIVSVCTPVPTHAPIVLDVIESGVVSAVHCEKPMANTWGGATEMAEAATTHDVQLTFNHQRRFAAPWRRAKALLDDGAIGDLERIEMGGPNFFDHGTHHADLCGFFAGDVPAEWIIGQLDYRDEDVRYGVHNENHLLAQWAYENGVTALASTGVGHEFVGAAHRLVGTDGTIEVHPEGVDASLRVRRAGETDWDHQSPEASNAVHAGIRHLVEALDAGEQPDNGAANARNATELLFGAYESARRRGRVEFPLDITDHPLEAMVDSGALTPE